MKRLLLCGGTVGLLSPIALATPTVNVGNQVLAPNLAGQPVRISVSGGDAVQGADLNAEIADGGPGVVPGDTALTGPAFTAANLVSGTIFAGNNSGQQDLSSFSQTPQAYSGSIVTNTGTVNASGLLATLTLDTTGFSTPGSSFPLRLKGFSNAGVSGDSDFIGASGDVLASNITNGNIIITYPQDLDLNGTVGFSDLLKLAQNYGRTGATPLQGDIDRNGTVGFSDLLSLAQNYNKSLNTNLPAPSVVALSAVPEPGILALVGIGAAMLRRRR